MTPSTINPTEQLFADVRKWSGRSGNDGQRDGYRSLAESMLATESAMAALQVCLSRQTRFWLRAKTSPPLLFFRWIERANGWLEAIIAIHGSSLARLRRLLPFLRIRIKTWDASGLPGLLYEANQRTLTSAVSLDEEVLTLCCEASFPPHLEAHANQADWMLHYVEEIFRILGQKRELLKPLFADLTRNPAMQEADAALLRSLKNLEARLARLRPTHAGWVTRIREDMERNAGISPQRITVRVEAIDPARPLAEPWLNTAVFGGRGRRERSSDSWDE